MSTRVSQFAARLVETGWLTALIVVPVFFDVWSQRVFEPDKLTLLRSIALFMIAAAAVVLVERGMPTRTAIVEWLKVPIVAPVLALTGAYLLSSVLSVTPYMSIMGGYNRLQGLFTWLAYVMLFLSIVSLLRDRLQLDRLLYAVILPSLPVGLYGIVQKFGQEIMPWQGNTSVRIASTMGNSIFVAAYLILTVPLTIVRLASAMRDLDEDEGNAAVLRVSGYLVLLAVQVIAVVFSQSRGPLLGLFGAVFFLMLLMATVRMSRRATLSVLGIGALAAAFLVVFNLPSSPLAGLRDDPYIGRLGRVFETESGTGRVRVLIWQGATELITADPFRTLVGWGPESMHVAYNPYYPPELGRLESRNASPDRSHNETFDALVTTGLIGFAAYIFLFTSLFYYALKWLGLNDSASAGRGFLSLWLGGGVLAVLGFWLWSGGWAFTGVALPAGMIAGLFAFVTLRALRGWVPPDRPGTLLIAGLTAALIAHFIEIHFGIAIAATRTLFFALAGALVVAGHFAQDDEEILEVPDAPVAPVRQRRRRGKSAPAASPQDDFSRRLWIGRGWLLLMLLITLVFSFVVFTNIGGDPGASEQELAQIRQQRFVLVWLFGMTWGIGTLILGTETLVLKRSSQRGLLAYLAITFGGMVLYGLLHFGILSAGARGGAATSTSLIFVFYSAVATLMIAWAATLASGDPAPARISRTQFAYAYPLLFIVAGILALTLNVNEVLADIHYKQGWVVWHAGASRAQSMGDVNTALTSYDRAIAEYDTAIRMDSSEDYYQLFKGKALLESADAQAARVDSQLSDELGSAEFSEYADTLPTESRSLIQQRDAAFQRAVDQLTLARDMAPLNTDHHANLGRAYQVWADRTYDATIRAERFDLSRVYFADAIEHSPNNAGLREELATTEYLAGDEAAARERVAEALEIDPEYGRPYRLLATMAKDAENFEEAAESYRAYLDSRDGRNDAAAWSGLAFVEGKRGDYDAAIAANQKVLELLGGRDLDTLRNMAILANQAGRPLESCRYVALGLQEGEDPGLLQLSRDLGCAGMGVELPTEELTPTVEMEGPLVPAGPEPADVLSPTGGITTGMAAP